METMLRDAAISFPMLGGLTIDPPVSFTLFGHQFYFYGLIIAVGFLLAILYCSRTAPRFGLTADNLYDMVLWALPIGIVGARLYFVAFQWNDYKDNLLDIFKIWNGGLAIYGGILAGAVTAVIWARRKKIPFGAMLDLGCFGLLIGQTVGRWGNFMNREAFGGVTDVFCRMGLTPPGQETIYVHPTFLYESVWNLVGFLLLSSFAKRRRQYDGQVFLLYALWYGLGRVWIEGLRTDSLYIAGTTLRASQVLAGVSVLASAALLLYFRNRPHKPLYASHPAPPESEPTPPRGE